MLLHARNLLLVSMVGFIFFLDQESQARVHTLQDLTANDELLVIKTGTDYTQTDFYTISDFQQKIKVDDSFQTPMNLGSDFFNKVLSEPAENADAQTELSLLDWIQHHEDSHSIEKYMRQKHFGSWIKDPYSGTCMNTRSRVLERDSLDPVGFDAQNPCRVATGRWIDPYTGNEYTNANDIQIDHFVPLKNAYINGGWQWSTQERCLYANFLGNGFHLLPVLGEENSTKGDSSPDKYIPPNKAYTCKYIENWLKIKAIWRLRLSPTEAAGIKQIISDNNCDKSEYFMSEYDLEEQRRELENYPSTCQRRGFFAEQKKKRQHNSL